MFPVTAALSMADMGVRIEGASLLVRHGNWSMILRQIPAHDVNQINPVSGISSISVPDTANENQTALSETSDENHQTSDPIYYVYFQEDVGVKE